MAAIPTAVINPAAHLPAVGPGDRLSFTLFLAAALHAALIFGVTFTYITNQPSTHTMEVTLAQHKSKNKPKKVDYLAQFNQLGSGTLEEKALLTTPNKAEFQDTEIRETAQNIPERTLERAGTPDQSIVTTIVQSEDQVVQDNQPKDPEKVEAPPSKKRTLLIRSLQIASLQARLDRQRQIFAKRPRIKRLTSLSTASSTDAFYLNSWRRKIESIGNLNYPMQARKNKLYGSLRLMVAILPDGSLREVELLESSGHQVLDDAAMRIVRLASPFAPFPDDLRASTDVLEIIRTWQFRKNSSLRSF